MESLAQDSVDAAIVLPLGDWQELYRVLKPGAHVLVFGGTQDWDLVSLELRLARFENRDTIAAEVLGGWEPLLLFRKPFGGTVADNITQYGTGALNVDACRIRTTEGLSGGAYSGGGRQADLPGASRSESEAGMFAPGGGRLSGQFQQPKGRWPTNMTFTHSPGCKRVGTKKVRGSTNGQPTPKRNGPVYAQDDYTQKGMIRSTVNHVDEDGTETVEAWQCTPGCPVAAIDGQSGNLTSGTGAVRTKSWAGYHGGDGVTGKEEVSHGDSGGASRFFPQFKDQRAALAWLVRLVCPQGGTILCGNEAIRQAATHEGAVPV
jgi:hypothetical protein